MADDSKRRERRASRSTAQPFTRSVAGETRPGPFDVLLGRGKANQQHEGNRRFQTIINENRDRYNTFSCRDDKTNTTRDIVGFVKTAGDMPGRFLKRDKLTNGWQEVDDETARVKAAQALRYHRDDSNSSSPRSARSTIAAPRPSAVVSTETSCADLSSSGVPAFPQLPYPQLPASLPMLTSFSSMDVMPSAASSVKSPIEEVLLSDSEILSALGYSDEPAMLGPERQIDEPDDTLMRAV